MWGIALHKNDEVPLARQLFLALSGRIMSGQIAPGDALPSTRELAGELCVSRNTVCEAYTMLWTEGFIINHPGAASRVADGLAVNILAPERPAAEPKPVPVYRYDFKTGQPDLTLFPWAAWNRDIAEAAARLAPGQMDYSGPKGYAPLCEEIARWLLRSRGMAVDPADVFVTSGATQALYLLVDILRREGRAFALEDPSHPGIRGAILDKGYGVYWMPVDEQGADVTSLTGKAVSAAYVTPSHQFPLGGILPAGCRAELIRLAREGDFYIIEDDYDSEYRYTGAPVSPLYSMDPSRVVYVGTFSKTLFPALRLGFAILPRSLQAAWKHARQYMDVQNPLLEQAALTEFLRKRQMDRHIRRMSKVYGEKRTALITALDEAFGGRVQVQGDASGLHVALRFPGMQFGPAFEKACREASLRVRPVSRFCVETTSHGDTLLAGYGHLKVEEIVEGVRVLKEVIFSR